MMPESAETLEVYSTTSEARAPIKEIQSAGQKMADFIRENYPPLKYETKSKPRPYALATLLVRSQRWAARGNEKWAEFYGSRAIAVRRLRRKHAARKVEGFDWRKALGLNVSRAETTPRTIPQTTVAASKL